MASLNLLKFYYYVIVADRSMKPSNSELSVNVYHVYFCFCAGAFSLGSDIFPCYFSISSSGQDNFCLIHVSLIPVLGVVGEQVIFRNLLSLNLHLKFKISFYFIFLF